MPLHVTPKSISLRTRETQIFHATGAAGTVAWSIEPRSEILQGRVFEETE